MTSKITIPSNGSPITQDSNGNYKVPNNPIIPFVEGDGIGIDITPPMLKAVDAAVKKAYGNSKKIHWLEVFAGEKATQKYGENQYLPDETIQTLKKYKISIKGPLSTPVGGGIRSLNVAMRQIMDLYVCLRPVRYFDGIASVIKNPSLIDMVIFRENSEDIYAGIEWESGSSEAKQMIEFLQNKMGVNKIRFPESSAIGIKPISKEGTRRLVRNAIQFAFDQKRKNVTLVHKGNIMKFTEGAFAKWGYELAAEEFGAKTVDGITTMYHQGQEIELKDVIADAFFQQALLKPHLYDVIATMNLNGDYISDALAAQVGGIGIAPGANLSDEVAIFEATHGTAPKMAGMDKANPSSLMLSAIMMLNYLGWHEAADALEHAMATAIKNGDTTYDLVPEGKTPKKSSEFGEVLVKILQS